MVPLSTHHQPAIRHAVVALASLHERFENNDKSILSSDYDIASGGFALQQYNRAIVCLIKPVIAGAQQGLDTSLVACILFACFEVANSLSIYTFHATFNFCSKINRHFEAAMVLLFLTFKMASRSSLQPKRTPTGTQIILRHRMFLRTLVFLWTR